MGPPDSPGWWHLDPAIALDTAGRHPERFRVQLGVDPTAGTPGRRRLRSLAADPAVVGLHLYPHWFGLRPDDPSLYPWYQLAGELDLPIQVQVGQCLVYNRDRPMRTVGFPEALETAAVELPEVRFVASHLGFPWVEQVMAVASSHENVWICTDSYGPRHWPDALVRFVEGPGRTRVMFGTMWPTIGYSRATSEIAQLGLSDAARTALLGGNAAEVYRIGAPS
jgi:predicted TIM-barrel fold metal-dependent hydrolase